MKKNLTILTILIALSSSINGQTNVSGGIYSNTTWSLANSPYIVTDTVAVFANVTLTINPGVIVKFNNNGMLLVKQQGTLIATGTITDSITFTSNLSSPGSGSWNCIYLRYSSQNCKFNYCKINYSNQGIAWSNITTPIKHSTFIFNGYGVYENATLIDSCVFENNNYGANAGSGNITNSTFRKNQYGLSSVGQTIEHCVIDSNTICGIYFSSGSPDSIRYNLIENNGIGIRDIYGQITINNNTIENNNIGLQMEQNPYPQNIFCNTICNNTAFDLKYLSTSAGFNIGNNYWCTTDSIAIEALIYDGYDNINYGLVSFMPVNGTSSECNSNTGISVNNYKDYFFTIFPNPVSKQFFIEANTTENLLVNLYDVNGRHVFGKNIPNKSSIDVSNLNEGVYSVVIKAANYLVNKKLVILR